MTIKAYSSVLLFYSILRFAIVIVIIVIQKSSCTEFLVSNLSADTLHSACGHQQELLVIREATLLFIIQFNTVLLNRTVLSHVFKKESSNPYFAHGKQVFTSVTCNMLFVILFRFLLFPVPRYLKIIQNSWIPRGRVEDWMLKRNEWKEQ